MTALALVLIDDHPVVRAGIRALLDAQPDLRVVGEGASLAEAIDAVTANRPDVVLMDLNLGGGADGVDATRAIRALPDPPAVLVLTTYDTEADVLKALDAGAAGYLLKDVAPEVLWDGIRTVAGGGTVFAASVAARLIRRSADPSPGITAREVQVLELLSRGLSNRELARELLVSEATVKSHLSHIYGKLGVDTRAGAVTAAIERRVIRT
ncbi:response regulator [Cumulibacter soli]|uniref:response regulator n=1 Tax=Cumulibacter soli TaxID=2546344 RepID=UPI001068A382|nr:response regulator transcription factor [Cumulibacter soli]